jgi:hypothetical protein
MEAKHDLKAPWDGLENFHFFEQVKFELFLISPDILGAIEC